MDAIQVLDSVPPHLVAEQLVAEAQRIAGMPVALYLVDIEAVVWCASPARENSQRISMMSSPSAVRSPPTALPCCKPDWRSGSRGLRLTR